jgi:hypothetical protein
MTDQPCFGSESALPATVAAHAVLNNEHSTGAVRALCRLGQDGMRVLEHRFPGLRTRLFDALHSNVDIAADVLACESGFEYSWLHSDDPDDPRGSVAAAILMSVSDGPARSALLRAALSENPMVPFDTRLHAVDRLTILSRNDRDASGPVIQAAIARLRGLARRRRSVDDQLALSGNGIDHAFPIPDLPAGRVALVESAARSAAALISAQVASNLISALVDDVTVSSEDRRLWMDWVEGERHPSLPPPLPEICRVVHDDLGTLATPAEYIVEWDSIVASAQGHEYTIAEMLRVCLLGGEFLLPDARTQQAKLSLYRSALRVSRNAIIGLGAGAFCVEHGLMSAPSRFYLGRGATLGKSFMIDTTGDVAIGRSAFLGGGFMPILLHTHKHVGGATTGGVDERKAIRHQSVAISAGARIPMSRSMMIEASDIAEGSVNLPGVVAVEHS